MNITQESIDMELSNKELKELLKEYGKYDSKNKFLMLFDNILLKDKKLLQICQKNKVYLQLDLFTSID